MTPHLDELVHEHRAALMAHAERMTSGDRAWAEDVVQETFIRAWQHLDRMTPERGSVRSWLLRVAHNVAVDGHRGRRPQPVDVQSMPPAVDPAGDRSEDVLAGMVVDDALATLDHHHRVVLEQTYLRDQTVAQAAQALDLPIGTVKSRVFYALRRLRAAMPEPACS